MSQSLRWLEPLLQKYGAPPPSVKQYSNWDGYDEAIDKERERAGFGEWSGAQGYYSISSDDDSDEPPAVAKPSRVVTRSQAAARAGSASVAAPVRPPTPPSGDDDEDEDGDEDEVFDVLNPQTNPTTATTTTTTTQPPRPPVTPATTGRRPPQPPPANHGLTVRRLGPDATGRIEAPEDEDEDMFLTGDLLELPTDPAFATLPTGEEEEEEDEEEDDDITPESPPMPKTPRNDDDPSAGAGILIASGNNNSNNTSPLAGKTGGRGADARIASGADFYWTGYVNRTYRRAGEEAGRDLGLLPPEDALAEEDTESDGSMAGEEEEVGRRREVAGEVVRTAVGKGQRGKRMGVREVFNDRKEFYRAMEDFIFGGVFDREEVEAVVGRWVDGLGKAGELREERERWRGEVEKVEEGKLVRGLGRKERKELRRREKEVMGRRKGVSVLFGERKVFGELGRQVEGGHKWWGKFGRVPRRLVKEFRATEAGCRLQGLVWEDRLSLADFEIFLRRWLERRYVKIMENLNAAQRRKKLRERWERKEKKMKERLRAATASSTKVSSQQFGLGKTPDSKYPPPSILRTPRLK